MNNSKDLFIRRVYTHKGVVVVADIDLIAKTISLVEKNGNDTFNHKRWLFADRTKEYINGWLVIFEAMAYAVSEAKEVLDEADARNAEEFERLLLALAEPTLDNVKIKSKARLSDG
jgi:hypothetical protein